MNETNIGLGNMYTDEETTAPTHSKNLILKEIPGEDSPIIMKFVPDLLAGKVSGRFNEYWEIREHGHVSGLDKDTNRPIISMHPCQRTLGEASCPECDAYFDLLKKIKLAGGKDTQQGKEMNKIAEILKPRKKGWILFVTPGEDCVRAFKASESVINMLWGKPASQNYPEIPSLVADMKAKGMSPYQLRGNPLGWVALWKTGVKLGTRYHTQIAAKEEVELLNGRPIGTKKVFVSAEVSEYLLNSFDVKNLPDTRKFESMYAFTMEESIAFAKNPLITPQRVLDMFKKEYKKAEDAHEADEQQSSSVEHVMSQISGQSNTTLGDVDMML